jgi:hypothetical protein
MMMGRMSQKRKENKEKILVSQTLQRQRLSWPQRQRLRWLRRQAKRTWSGLAVAFAAIPESKGHPRMGITRNVGMLVVARTMARSSALGVASTTAN